MQFSSSEVWFESFSYWLIFLLIINSDFLSLHDWSVNVVYSWRPGNSLKKCIRLTVIPGQGNEMYWLMVLFYTSRSDSRFRVVLLVCLLTSMAALFADKIMVDGLCLVLARSLEGQNWSHNKNVARRVCEVQANILFWAPWIWGVLWTWWWFPQREKTYSIPLCRGRTTGSCFCTTVGNQLLAVMCTHFNVLVVFYTFLAINLKCSSIVILAPMNLFHSWSLIYHHSLYTC